MQLSEYVCDFVFERGVMSKCKTLLSVLSSKVLFLSKAGLSKAGLFWSFEISDNILRNQK